MSDNNSIYTIYVSPEYKEFTNTLLAVSVITIILHLLMANQTSIGIIGGVFNSPFSDTFAKLLVSIAFYYLVFRKLVFVV
jgi:hypothetical protein